MKILALEPFFGGSHKKWLTQWQYSSDHQIDLLTLPGRHWKWRMYGGAVSLSRKYLASSKKYDLLIAVLPLSKYALFSVPPCLYDKHRLGLFPKVKAKSHFPQT